MSVKAGVLFLTLLVGSIALPVKDDMSIYFDHTDSSARIIGGTVAGRVPYMVALTSGVSVRNLVCGASLVTTRHIMTAAHCIIAVLSIDGVLASSLRGYVNTNHYASGGTPYTISTYNIHPEFDYPTIKNDIGFLITSNNVVLSNTVSLVALSFDLIGAGVPSTATGWGATERDVRSPVLLQLNSNVVDGNECVTWVARRSQEIPIGTAPPVDPRVEICAFNYTPGRRGMCNGDSGSPLMRTDLNQQIGIVSWGIPCAHAAPDMFVRISAFRSWIEQSTR